jgi:hypothetical protein
VSQVGSVSARIQRAISLTTVTDGILQSMRLEAKAKDSHMQDAFKDLEVLMVRAGEMVSLDSLLSSSGTLMSPKLEKGGCGLFDLC